MASGNDGKAADGVPAVGGKTSAVLECGVSDDILPTAVARF